MKRSQSRCRTCGAPAVGHVLAEQPAKVYPFNAGYVSNLAPEPRCAKHGGRSQPAKGKWAP